MSVTNIHIREALERTVSENGILVDVREPAAFREGHIPMAINVPLQDILHGGGKLPRNRVLVLYCDSGLHSMTAARYLDKKGYRVINTTGGLSAYKKALTLKH